MKDIEDKLTADLLGAGQLVKRGRGRPKGSVPAKSANERMKALKERRDAAADAIFENGLESASDAELVYALADRLKGQAKGLDFAPSIVTIARTLMDRYNVN
jgi:hypothetical protein